MILKIRGFNFNHIAEMIVITIFKKLDLSLEFYIKHFTCALEWKTNAMIDKKIDY